MRIFTDNDNVERATGNGSLLLVVEEGPSLCISRYGDPLLRAAFDRNGAYHRSWREGEGLRVDFYGMPEPADPTLKRSAVSATFHFVDETATLVVGICAAHAISFRLHPATDGRIAFFERLFSEEGGIPCVKITSASDACLYMAYDGDLRFDEERETLLVSRGQGRLLFLSPDEALDRDRLIRLFATAFPAIYGRRPPDKSFSARANAGRERVLSALSPVEEGLLRSLVGEMREELYARQSARGGLFLSCEDNSLAEQARVALFFCADGNRRQAEAFLSYLSRLLARYRRLPEVVTADGEEGREEGDVFGETAVAVLLFLRAYASRFGVKDGEVLALTRWASDRALRALRNGSLPLGNDEAFPSAYRFVGSAKATLRFLAAERFALSILPPSKKGVFFRVSSAVSFAESTFLGRFATEDGLCLTDPQRAEGMHHPHTLWGRCDGCGRRGALIRRESGYYHGECEANVSEALPPLRVPDEENVLPLLDAGLGVGVLPPVDGASSLDDRASLEALILRTAVGGKVAEERLLLQCCDTGRSLSSRAAALAACLRCRSTANPNRKSKTKKCDRKC